MEEGQWLLNDASKTFLTKEPKIRALVENKTVENSRALICDPASVIYLSSTLDSKIEMHRVCSISHFFSWACSALAFVKRNTK